MDIQLSDQTQRYIRSQIESGRYQSEEELIEAAVHLLSAGDLKTSGTKIEQVEDSAAVDQEVQRRLFAEGLLSEIKPSSRQTGGWPPFTPIPVRGEPVSETIIRDRR